MEDWQRKAINKRFCTSDILEEIGDRRRIKFFIAEIDNTSNPKYYGFVGNDTNLCETCPWYIMKESGTSYRYFFGNIDFDRAWMIRAGLPYEHAYKFKGFHDKYDKR